MQALCRQPPTAKVSLPSAADGKEATWQATVLPGRLTYLVSLPTVADGKEKKTLPTAADGKEEGRQKYWTSASVSPLGG